MGSEMCIRDRDVPKVSVWLRVKLVEDDGMTVESMLRVRLRADALVPTASVMDNVAKHLRPTSQVLVVGDHLLSDVEDDVGLSSVACRADNLRALLAISEEHVQGDGRAQVALSILARYLDVAGAVLARAVLLLPSKQRSYDVVLLPVLQQERLAAQVALTWVQNLSMKVTARSAAAWSK